ncbi:MAG: sugar kinase [Verrucomicrobiae bacterium]|nr:sugar kinase [Verrucomicrobiae bacterium]
MTQDCPEHHSEQAAISAGSSAIRRSLAVIALGEVMIRLSPPGAGRLESARTLEVDVGGGEYNVVHALARFGWPAAFVTRLPDHELSRVVWAHARAAGLETRWMLPAPHDGVGRSGRLGLNFAEIGAGVRGGLVLFDRGHSSASQFRPEDVDWSAVFGSGARWFHASGIFPVLAPNCADTLEAALVAARGAGLTVSYDLNYRASLCPPETAAAINRRMLKHVEVLVGSPDGFEWLLADRAPSAGRPASEIVKSLRTQFPGLKVVAGTVRTVRSATRHELAGFFHREGEWTADPGWPDLEVLDRVGTGDAFSAGVIHGLLSGWPPDRTLRFALAHAALVHTIRGDTSQFTVSEVEALAGAGGAAMRR